MYAEFSNIQTTASGVLQILGISLIGFLFAKLRFISRRSCTVLTNLVVRFFLPCLIISNITRSFDPITNPNWWILPLCSLGMYSIAFTLGIILFVKNKYDIRNECLLSCTFQNCGFLPAALVAFVCAGKECSEIMVFVFLSNIFFDVSIWTSSNLLLKKKTIIKARRFPFINPPSVSTFISLIIVFVFGTNAIPTAVARPVSIIGNATFPIALIMMGAVLYHNRGYALDYIVPIIISVCAKLILLPLLIGVILVCMQLDPRFEFVIFLQSIMPTAVTLVLIGEYIGGDNKYISGVIFYSHIVSVLTIPAWLLIYNKIIA